MITREELQELHKELWALRDELEPNFPTPPPLDALRFSVCEYSEALDAYLRIKGGYKRNHAKEPDIYGELADCALMLMTALRKQRLWINRSPVWEVHDLPFELSCLASELGTVLFECQVEGHWTYLAEMALYRIATVPDMNMLVECRKRMAGWRAKWGKP